MSTTAGGYAVFFFPQAIEALGDAVKPFLVEGEHGQHIACHEVDTGGALIEMTLRGRDDTGHERVVELMVPQSMVRMIVSTQGDGHFGFGPRQAVAPPAG